MSGVVTGDDIEALENEMTEGEFYEYYNKLNDALQTVVTVATVAEKDLGEFLARENIKVVGLRQRSKNSFSIFFKYLT